MKDNYHCQSCNGIECDGYDRTSLIAENDKLAEKLEAAQNALRVAEHELISLAGLYATDLAAVVEHLKPDCYFSINTDAALKAVQAELK